MPRQQPLNPFGFVTHPLAGAKQSTGRPKACTAVLAPGETWHKVLARGSPPFLTLLFISAWAYTRNHLGEHVFVTVLEATYSLALDPFLGYNTFPSGLVQSGSSSDQFVVDVDPVTGVMTVSLTNNGTAPLSLMMRCSQQRILLT